MEHSSLHCAILAHFVLDLAHSFIGSFCRTFLIVICTCSDCQIKATQVNGVYHLQVRSEPIFKEQNVV